MYQMYVKTGKMGGVKFVLAPPGGASERRQNKVKGGHFGVLTYTYIHTYINRMFVLVLRFSRRVKRWFLRLLTGFGGVHMYVNVCCIRDKRNFTSGGLLEL